jgi:16S rRNA (guanine(1405)-N(7))-methyltransferase
MEINTIKNYLIKHIKEKKELSTVDNEFVLKFLEKIIKKNNLVLEEFEKYTTLKQLEKSKKYKLLVSQCRSELRKVYGVFITQSTNNIEQKIKKINSYTDDLIDEILGLHQSSKERQSHYSQIYLDLFELLFSIGLEKNYSLLDLACGYNPFSYKYFLVKPKYYFASDLSTEDMKQINIFFEKTKINGFAKECDLLNEIEFDNLLNIVFEKIKKLNVCFLLKTIDSLESVSRHSSKKILTKINADFFVVSFPKKTLGGKKTISENKRSWFEKFIQKTFSEYRTYEIENEFFYIIKK